MTKQEIIHWINNEFDNNKRDFVSSLEIGAIVLDDCRIIQRENNDVYSEDSYGYESSYLERIIEVEGKDIYFKMTGTNSSYDGTIWEEIKQVQPQQKTITVWNLKN